MLGLVPCNAKKVKNDVYKLPLLNISSVNTFHFFRKDDLCDKPCTGDLSQKCGGYLTMNVYETGVEDNKEVNLSFIFHSMIISSSLRFAFTFGPNFLQALIW